MNRRIIHVDMDEFFAAVEKLDNPELVGQCVLVGGNPAGRGVVSTASYEARKFGCHSAMPMATAVRLCPEAVIVRPRHERYAEFSRQVFDIFERFTPMVEPLSIDEAFLDVTGSERLLGPAETIARTIQATITEELHLPASLGVAPNKFLAKLASDLDKPNGLTVITEDTIHDVLDPLPVGKLWGVGKRAEAELEKLHIRTIGKLRRFDADILRSRFGNAADHLIELANGIDDREVITDGAAKSIGQEITFARDVDEIDELRRVLLQQTDQVARRLRRAGLQARTVTLKLREGDFTTLTRSKTLGQATDITDTLWETARGLLAAWAKSQFAPLRLIGMTASQLTGGSGQLSLFDQAADHAKKRRVDQAVDRIAERFGDDAVRRGGGETP
ncbi:MAG: DNA polymerase IV [Planctomycetota bacterium]